MASDAAAAPVEVPRPLKEDPKIRFQMELEFVQSLANPLYLQYLAQQQMFQDQAFINYLRYLKYWQQPEYAKYIEYPFSLEMLELLQNQHFRSSLASPDTALLLHQKEFFTWMYYRHDREKQHEDSLADEAPEWVRKFLKSS
ncbi:mediator of RNA polymerase II transcription subunit 31 [Polychytrium aggregatum]|uniref:mediator of RNA polymerase II transcription subunit 31 n=1 Tax=Polychytrium aggregatum TaxID=110093 RepID=UPI0022FDB7FC|nr:mediator of RNA polymerase II transcription subunit 31 [Polychytrium aggregatum]KAI9207227.1 mediator of RNA polymerase II transcription subunit 31 [Polychytrium aggregatum]